MARPTLDELRREPERFFASLYDGALQGNVEDFDLLIRYFHAAGLTELHAEACEFTAWFADSIDDDRRLEYLDEAVRLRTQLYNENRRDLPAASSHARAIHRITLDLDALRGASFATIAPIQPASPNGDRSSSFVGLLSSQARWRNLYQPMVDRRATPQTNRRIAWLLQHALLGAIERDEYAAAFRLNEALLQRSPQELSASTVEFVRFARRRGLDVPQLVRHAERLLMTRTAVDATHRRAIIVALESGSLGQAEIDAHLTRLLPGRQELGELTERDGVTTASAEAVAAALRLFAKVGAGSAYETMEGRTRGTGAWPAELSLDVGRLRLSLGHVNAARRYAVDLARRNDLTLVHELVSHHDALEQYEVSVGVLRSVAEASTGTSREVLLAIAVERLEFIGDIEKAVTVGRQLRHVPEGIKSEQLRKVLGAYVAFNTSRRTGSPEAYVELVRRLGGLQEFRRVSDVATLAPGATDEIIGRYAGDYLVLQHSANFAESEGRWLDAANSYRLGRFHYDAVRCYSEAVAVGAPDAIVAMRNYFISENRHIEGARAFQQLLEDGRGDRSYCELARVTFLRDAGFGSEHAALALAAWQQGNDYMAPIVIDHAIDKGEIGWVLDVCLAQAADGRPGLGWLALQLSTMQFNEMAKENRTRVNQQLRARRMTVRHELDFIFDNPFFDGQVHHSFEVSAMYRDAARIDGNHRQDWIDVAKRYLDTSGDMQRAIDEVDKPDDETLRIVTLAALDLTTERIASDRHGIEDAARLLEMYARQLVKGVSVADDAGVKVPRYALPLIERLMVMSAETGVLDALRVAITEMTVDLTGYEYPELSEFASLTTLGDLGDEGFGPPGGDGVSPGDPLLDTDPSGGASAAPPGRADGAGTPAGDAADLSDPLPGASPPDVPTSNGEDPFEAERHDLAEVLEIANDLAAAMIEQRAQVKIIDAEPIGRVPRSENETPGMLAIERQLRRADTVGRVARTIDVDIIGSIATAAESDARTRCVIDVVEPLADVLFDRLGYQQTKPDDVGLLRPQQSARKVAAQREAKAQVDGAKRALADRARVAADDQARDLNATFQVLHGAIAASDAETLDAITGTSGQPDVVDGTIAIERADKGPIEVDPGSLWCVREVEQSAPSVMRRAREIAGPPDIGAPETVDTSRPQTRNVEPPSTTALKDVHAAQVARHVVSPERVQIHAALAEARTSSLESSDFAATEVVELAESIDRVATSGPAGERFQQRFVDSARTTPVQGAVVCPLSTGWAITSTPEDRPAALQGASTSTTIRPVDTGAARTTSVHSISSQLTLRKGPTAGPQGRSSQR